MRFFPKDYVYVKHETSEGLQGKNVAGRSALRQIKWLFCFPYPALKIQMYNNRLAT